MTRRGSVVPIRPDMLAAVMNDPGAAKARGPFNPKDRGYAVGYRANEVNYCPGCGRTHWFIGRATAECAFCATAMPLLP